jgi:uncharacterized protein YukE
VAGDGFEALASALLDASARYATAGESFAEAVARFQSRSQVPDNAWGRLAGAGTIASQYEEFRRQIVMDLTKVYKALAAGAVNLAAAGALYAATDAAVAAQVRDMLKTGFSEQQIGTVQKLDSPPPQG